MSWEVTVDLRSLWAPEEQGSPASGGGGEEEEEEEEEEECGREGNYEDPWEEMLHQLTARSVIRDFEKMAEKESDIEHGGLFFRPVLFWIASRAQTLDY